MTGPPVPGHNPYEFPNGDGRSEIVRSIITNFKKIPGLESVRLEESGTGVDKQIAADINTDVFSNGIIEAESAAIVANWWPLHDDEDRHWFKFHYYESSGFDCGWHRHDNNHVDDLTHYQERQSSDDEYDYYPYQPHFTNPVGLVWEIVDDRLVTRLEMRHKSSDEE